jgi:hypothetical protein
MDSYQPIYDAVRSRISGGNVGEIVADACRNAFDISHMKSMLLQDFSIAAQEMARPSVLFKPVLSIDGSNWCALLGENLVEGVAGFGETPHAAMEAFDQAFYKQKTPAAIRAALSLSGAERNTMGEV